MWAWWGCDEECQWGVSGVRRSLGVVGDVTCVELHELWGEEGTKKRSTMTQVK